MQKIFEFLVKLFGLTIPDAIDPTNKAFFEKLAGLFTAAVLVATIMIVIAVVLLIVVIVLAVKNKHKKEQLKAGGTAEDTPEMRNRIRNEIEPIIRKEIELEYKEKMPKSGVTDEQYDRLRKRLDEKDARITELSKALEKANATTHAISTSSNNSEINKTVSDLTLQNGLLTEQNNQYHNQITELQEEIAKLKEQKGKQQAAAQRAKQKAVEKVKADVAKEKEKEKEEKAAKEAAQKAAEKAAKEAAEKTAKEVAEKAAKEAAEKAAKEAAAKAKKEAEEKAAKEASEKSAKEAAQKAEPAEQVPENEVDNEYGNDDSEIKVTVKFDDEKGNWVVLRSDNMSKAYRRVATKQEALQAARELAKRLQAQLIVHNKDGKLSYNI